MPKLKTIWRYFSKLNEFMSQDWCFLSRRGNFQLQDSVVDSSSFPHVVSPLSSIFFWLHVTLVREFVIYKPCAVNPTAVVKARMLTGTDRSEQMACVSDYRRVIHQMFSAGGG
jgi:hypothetical protein